MLYRHRFQVAAPLATVADFHRQAASLAAITPPPVRVQLEEAPAALAEGATLRFALVLGPLRLRWVARIEAATAHGFVDRQLEGPFARWEHRHTFVPLGSERTEVCDEVRATLRRDPVWGPIGLFLWLGLPALFAYRAWKTRALLERPG
jgi:ligand-binding SRPBCC domain-containing protein